MSKKLFILTVLIAFAIGFVAGTATVLVKGSKESKESRTSQPTLFPTTKEPISIELTDKIEDLKETVRENPKDLAAWLKLGNIYAEYHRYREAVEAYGQSLSIKPNDPDIRTNLGLMLRGLGDYGGAIEEFKRAAQYGPKQTSSRYYLGLTLIQNKNNIQEGIKAWEDYLKLEPRGQRASQVRIAIERLRTEMARDRGQKAN